MSSQELSDFKYVEGGRNLPNGGFTRNRMMLLSEVKDFRVEHSNTGLYLSAYIYDTTEVKEANLYADFYLDYDSEDDFELARMDALASIRYMGQRFTYNIPESMFRIYFSGNKGIHLVVPAAVFGIEPNKHLNEHYKTMATRISEEIPNGTLDLPIYDRRRLFRMANSKHMKSGLFKIPLTYSELATMEESEIRRIAMMPRKIEYNPPYEITRAKNEYLTQVERWKNRYGKKFDNRRTHNAKPLDFTPACIQELIDAGPQKGQRNNTASVLTSFWKRQGCTEQRVWEYLVRWNNESMSEEELRNTMQSVYKNDYEYGCSTLETLATCVGNKCPLFKERKN